MRIYKYDEWDIELYESELHSNQESVYVDLEGIPITGILEDFWYFKKGDSRNNQYVKNGKRVLTNK